MILLSPTHNSSLKNTSIWIQYKFNTTTTQTFASIHENTNDGAAIDTSDLLTDQMQYNWLTALPYPSNLDIDKLSVSFDLRVDLFDSFWRKQ